MKKRCFFRLLTVLTVAALLFTGCAEKKSEQMKESTIAQGSETGEVPQQSQPLPTAINLGDRMPDLTFTDVLGNNISLNTLLQEKELVVLNFWFADCVWCRREFPVMEVAYQNFREDVEILALNPYDSEETIAAFREESSLSFPMISCSQDLAMAFGVNGYPTSVCIDREGTVSLIHSGAITDSTLFNQLFQAYTASDYHSEVYNHLNEILN